MITVLLATISSFIDQLGFSIIKKVENDEVHTQDVWTTALITWLSSSILIFVITVVKGKYLLDQSIVWIFIPRIILEIIQLYVTFKALKIAELSSFNFIRVFTIVLVVIFELIFLKTSPDLYQYLGILITILAVAYTFRHGIKQIAGSKFILLSTINAGILVVLTRYQFQHNDPYLNESIVRVFSILILFSISMFKNKFKFRINKKSLLLLPTKSLVGILNLTALSLGNAAIYTTAERGGSLLSSVIVGHKVFKETSLGEKLGVALALSIGIILLTL